LHATEKRLLSPTHRGLLIRNPAEQKLLQHMPRAHAERRQRPIFKIAIDTPFACNGFGKGHSFLSDPAQAAAHPAFAPLSRDDAYALVSTACDVNITELVDTNDGVHVLCAKSLFSGAPAPQK